MNARPFILPTMNDGMTAVSLVTKQYIIKVLELELRTALVLCYDCLGKLI